MTLPITITSITPGIVDESGGNKITIVGDFTGDTIYEYNVYIGPLGTTSDPKALSGTPGAVNTLKVFGTTILRCYTPELTKYTTAHVLIRRTDGAKEQLWAGTLTVLAKQYYGNVFEARKLLPPYYAVGPRNWDMVPPS
jgi:hypothetical protein